MDVEDVKELLRNRGLKATSGRINLLTRMQEYHSAMPYSEIQQTMTDIDRVTLYRTLESLIEQGIIHKVYFQNKETYYAICGNKCGKNQHIHDHIHFRCTECESVTCQKPDESVKISIAGNKVKNVSIYVEGLCSRCNENTSKESDSMMATHEQEVEGTK